MSFDNYVKTNFKNLTRSTKVFMNEAYNADAQSRQAEIDGLKKELETLQGMHDALSLTAVDLVEDKESALGYLDEIESFGNFKNIEVINKIKGILRGNPND